MRERPPLADDALVAALAAGWGVAAAAVEFLPVGDDAGAWSFRAVAGDGAGRFLKVRRGRLDPAAVLVPRYLRDHGLEEVVAAVPAAGGDPWRPLDGFTLLVYPWVDGVPALERGLDEPALVVHQQVGQVEVAAGRGRLGRGVAGTAGRDLCFLAEDGRRFLEGYGPATLDPLIVAYYRWEWVVQELADYGGRVADDRAGEATRRHALEELGRLFAPGDVVEAARRADRGLEVSRGRGRRGGRRAGGAAGSRPPPPGRPGG
jgi:hypothetical protein